MPLTSSISALFLDIGGVLLTNGWDRASRQKAAAQFQLNFQEMDERHHLTFDTYEEGKISLEQYLNRVVFYQDQPFSRQEFIEFMHAQSQPHPEMIEFVRDLKIRYGLKTAAVSNEGRELTQYRIQKFDLGKIIDFFISSSFVHYRKPDEDIFRIALDIAQSPPERVVYIDDRPMFVEVARFLGIQGIVHTSLQSTQQELAEFGLRVGD